MGVGGREGGGGSASLPPASLQESSRGRAPLPVNPDHPTTVHSTSVGNHWQSATLRPIGANSTMLTRVQPSKKQPYLANRLTGWLRGTHPAPSLLQRGSNQVVAAAPAKFLQLENPSKMATAGSIPHFLQTFPFHCLMFESCCAWTDSTPCGQKTQNTYFKSSQESSQIAYFVSNHRNKIAIFTFIYCM